VSQELSREQLNAFAHGVHLSRKRFGKAKMRFYRDVSRNGANGGITSLAYAESYPGRFSIYRDPENRAAVVRTLGINQAELIRTGREYIRDHGCYPCFRHPTSQECQAH
jgi:hypothetical protein